MNTTKIIKASIKDGKLEINGLNPTDIKITCEGQADSTGYVIFGKGSAVYLVNTQPDLKETIEKLISVCDEIVKISKTQLMLGGTGSAPLMPFEPMGAAVDAIKKELEDKKLI